MNEQVTQYVWYAAYGSNINKERFMRYIQKCSDQTAPLEETTFIFSHNIYFASESKTWENKGTAFLDDSKPGMAYGKAYKISWEQFLDVKRLEGSKYRKQLMLGTIDGLPVYTFTAPTPYEVHNEPAQSYVKVIHEGLKNTYPYMSDNFILMYLYSRGILTKDDISVLTFIRHSKHGVSIEQMTQSGVSITGVKSVINHLKDLEIIKQDGRSVREGHGILDEEAVYYTRKGKREVIDTILLMKMS